MIATLYIPRRRCKMHDLKAHNWREILSFIFLFANWVTHSKFRTVFFRWKIKRWPHDISIIKLLNHDSQGKSEWGKVFTVLAPCKKSRMKQIFKMSLWCGISQWNLNYHGWDFLIFSFGFHQHFHVHHIRFYVFIINFFSTFSTYHYDICETNWKIFPDLLCSDEGIDTKLLSSFQFRWFWATPLSSWFYLLLEF